MTILLKRKPQRKRRGSPPPDPHGFESVGDILRRLRGDLEAQMTPDFNPTLSLRIDDQVQQEEGRP
jgi:hypothetical protein